MKRILLISVVFLAFASINAKATTSRLIAGLAYSPSHLATTYQELSSEDRIRQDLVILSKVTNRIRTYSVDNGMEKVPEIAHELGMTVSLGIWLGPDRGLNDLEIAKALAIISAYPSVIDRVFVGNETLLRKDLTLEELRGYLRAVRQGTHAPNIEITTGETWGFWQKYPSLAEDCDVIGAHILPYWDGYAIDNAMTDIVEQVALLEHLFPGKKIVIAETGWSSRGQPHLAAVPSPDAQKTFLERFVSSPTAKAYDYYIVEAFDQPWKIQVEGEVGMGWGLFDVDGKPKIQFLSNIRTLPAGRSVPKSSAP